MQLETEILENNTVEVARRDTLEKKTISQDEVVDLIENLLEEIQENLFTKAIHLELHHIT